MAMPSTTDFWSIDDLIAGSALLLTALSGIILHVIEMLAMCKLIKTVIGFRFFLTLSIADLGMLFLFGIIPGVAIFVPSLLVPLTAWKYGMHIVADTVWFSCCYLNVLIAITRFACVVFPLHFRLLRRQTTCWLAGIAMWTFALVQSCATNSASWFVAIWYTAGTYGMSCDLTAYAESGTRTYYLTSNGLFIVANLLIYSTTAAIIFAKKPVRHRFFNALLKPKSSTSVGQQQSAPPIQNISGGQANEPRRLSAVDVVEHYPKNGRDTLQRRRFSNNNMIIRTVNIVRSVQICPTIPTSYPMEMRLVIPCCVNALIFIVGQLFIMNGGIGPQGKWSDLSVMLIFCLQSIAPSILRLIFSKMLRRQFLALLKAKRNNGTKPNCADGIEQKKKALTLNKTVPVTPKKY